MKHRRIVYLFTLSLSLLFSGCASQVATLAGFKPADTSIDLKLVDVRPEIEKSSEFLSLSITNCDYSIRRLGDETTEPSRLSLLRSDVVRGLGTAVQGKTMTISHYTVFFNNAAATRGLLANMYKGAIPDLMQSMGSNCAREKTSGGWYAGTELTKPYSPFIVEISANIGGRQHSIRSVYSPSHEFNFRIKDAKDSQALFDSMKKANDMLIESLKLEVNKP